MRDKAIAILTKKLNGNTAKANTYWDIFVKGPCGGIEPDDADFALMDPQKALASLPELSRGVLTCLWENVPAPTLLNEANREHLSTAVLLREYLGEKPAPWVGDELTGRSRGLACLFLKDDGSVHVEASAAWIDWIHGGDPMGDGMEVDGKFRHPVHLGKHKPAKTFPVDPFAKNDSTLLTMPGYMSECGSSLANAKGVVVSDEKLSFLCLVMMHESPTTAEQRTACAIAVETTDMTKLFATYPLAKRAWDNGSRPPARITSSATKPKAPAPSADVVLDAPAQFVAISVSLANAPSANHVDMPDWLSDKNPAFPHHNRSAQRFMDLCATLYPTRDDILPMCREADLPLGHINWSLNARLLWPDVMTVAWSQMKIRQFMYVVAKRNPGMIINDIKEAVLEGIVNVGMDRAALMGGIHRSYVSSLKLSNVPVQQHKMDIDALIETTHLSDGTCPWQQYLRNGIHLAKMARNEKAILAFTYAFDFIGFTIPPYGSTVLPRGR